MEFAVILPLLAMMLLGIVSGGNAYQQKLSLTNGAREGARFGATLPTDSFTTLDDWLDNLATVATGAVDDGLGPGVEGRVVCVAYVYPIGTALTDRTTRRRATDSGPTYSGSTCFSDGRPSNERRVQVVLQRNSSLEGGLFHIPLTLSGKSVARYEGLG